MIDSVFKAGQKVWSFTWGWGKVESVDEDNLNYPIYVEFEHGVAGDYSLDGRWAKDEGRTLFFKEIPIPGDALIPPVEEIVLRTGDIVLFKNGQLRFVAKASEADSKTFMCHDSVPQDLDSAFGYVTSLKEHVKKVVGNIND
jgi:hypothetical protein